MALWMGVSFRCLAFRPLALSRYYSALGEIKCDDGSTVLPWSAPPRSAHLQRLRSEEFDIVVVGGGCVGAGVAWEASTRGLRVALVEHDDYASGTSGRSTKLIHGGIRYLEAAFKKLDPGMYHLVQEALEERAHLMSAAPYMARPQATLIPLHSWWEIPYVWAGAKVYDWLAGSKRFVPPSYFISASEALYQFPMLKTVGLKGAIIYYDGAHNDTRMNLTIALTAMQAGAAAANYCTVTAITKDPATGRANGVLVRDRLDGASDGAQPFAIRARAVVNATGCFGDALRALDTPACQPLIQGASGTHIILPDHFSPDKMGLIVPKTRDGRVLFLLPWEGSTIAGTTDHPCAISMAPRPTEEDIAFILEELNLYLGRPVRRSDVRAAWSGIRPLIKDPKADPSLTGTAALSRTHVVEVSPSGMVSIMGGKWTTYRRMAQDTVEAVAALPGVLRGAGGGQQQLPPSVTSRMLLLGADREGVVCKRKYHRIPVTLRESYGLCKETSLHLSANYGTRALSVAEVLKRDPGLGARLSPRYPFLLAEVVFAVEQEYAHSIVDVLARRTRLAFLDASAARGAVEGVAALMAGSLQWDEAERARQVGAALAFLDTMDGPASHQADGGGAGPTGSSGGDAAT
jgi:glycerol-3-phosphate dehydrogenase